MQKKADVNICFVGSARYSDPLGPTDEKKFRALKALGDIFVIGFSHGFVARHVIQHAHFYLLPELPWVILRYFEMFLIVPFLALWLILRYRVRILVAQSPYEGVSAAVAKNVAAWFGYKVGLVVESHGNFEEDLFGQRQILFPQLYRLFMQNAAHFSLKHADVFRAISRSTFQQLQRWSPGKLIFQFMAWTDIDAFFKASQAEKKSSPALILYAGILIPRKGVIHLLNAFAQIAEDFPDVRLILIGAEENAEYVHELQAQVKEYGLTKRVMFIPPLSQEKLAQRMAQASVFVLPSFSEGLGRVVVEAMAAGTPVIGSRVGGIPDLIEDEANGFLVPAGDEGLLAEKIRWMLEHPESARQMGRNATHFARSFFSTEVYVNGYRQIVESVRNLLEV